MTTLLIAEHDNASIKDATNKIYHVDWSPDSRFLAFSRGPGGEGDPKQPGTFQAACEIVGVHAAGKKVAAVRRRSDHLDAVPSRLEGLKQEVGLVNRGVEVMPMKPVAAGSLLPGCRHWEL